MTKTTEMTTGTTIKFRFTSSTPVRTGVVVEGPHKTFCIDEVQEVVKVRNENGQTTLVPVVDIIR